MATPHLGSPNEHMNVTVLTGFNHFNHDGLSAGNAVEDVSIIRGSNHDTDDDVQMNEVIMIICKDLIVDSLSLVFITPQRSFMETTIYEGKSGTVGNKTQVFPWPKCDV